MLHVLSFALFPVGAAMLGALIATYRPPTPHARSYIQHLAAGVVFSVVAVELLPDITRHHGTGWQVAIGFVVGVVSMLALRAWSHKLEARGSGAALGLLAGVAIDILLDGFLIGVTFSAGAKEGLLLTIALTFELLSLGLSVAAALGKAGVARPRILRISALLFSTLLVGAGLGAALVTQLPAAVLQMVLSFGLAALLYLVTEELLVEAHEEPETPLATGMFFAGFLAFLLLGMME